MKRRVDGAEGREYMSRTFPLARRGTGRDVDVNAIPL
jgi:hypothetical protein